MNRLILIACVALTPSAYAKCTGADSSCWPSSSDFKELGASLDGNLYTQDVADFFGFQAATYLHNLRISNVPAIAVMASSTSDVIAVVGFAAARNLLLSIKSTGHCYSGNCMAADSLHLDLSRMHDVTLNDGLLTVGPGADFDEMYKATDAADVLVAGGMCGTVGPVGFSLGGGHGPLARSFGLGADNIESFDIVLANSTLLTGVSAASHPDLFWAARGGGGGSYGVVTSMSIRVHAAPASMTSVVCNWPLKSGDETPGVSAYGEWVEETMPAIGESDDRWSFYTIVLKEPIPVEMVVKGWNKLTMDGLFSVEGLFAGDYDSDSAAKDEIAPLLALAEKYGSLGDCKITTHDSFLAWHSSRWFGKTPTDERSRMSTSFLQADAPAGHGAQLAETLGAQIFAMDTFNLERTFFGIQLGGAVGRVDAGASAISASFRGAKMLEEINSDWLLSTYDTSEMAWVEQADTAITAIDGFEGMYMNEANPLLQVGEYEELFWGTGYTRLQTVKAAYDPTGFFECVECVQARA